MLRGLDALAAAGIAGSTDGRRADVIIGRRPDGRWVANLAYPGATYAPPVAAGTPSPWITLIALRVLKKYASALVTAIPDLPPFGA